MGNIYYAPLLNSMRWSYSRLTSFENCAYAWYSRYLYGEEEAENFYSSYGSLVHGLLERYFKCDLRADELPIEFVEGFYADVAPLAYDGSIADKYMAAGHDYFINFSPPPYDVVGVEEKIEFEMNGNTFVGIVDLVCREPDGSGLVIIDHKSRGLRCRSSRKTPTKTDEELDKYLRQLYLYSVGVCEKYGELPTSLCFNCFRTGTFIKEPFCIDAFEETKKWATNLIEEIKNTEVFRPTLDWFYCTNLCGFRDTCCYYNDLMRGGGR